MTGQEKLKQIEEAVQAVISGKDAVIRRALTTILAGGHILLTDIPGVGKTTLALALSKTLGLSFSRVQFTPDVVPSDITGFTIYDKESGRFSYQPGAVLSNFFLADEINRTSSKTQSALLEVMQEGKVTVDGESHKVPQPFVVMATQNPVGTAGTQMLPEAQLDRFMVQLSMGYPDEAALVEILKRREAKDPLADVEAVTTAEELIAMQESVRSIYVDEKIYHYLAKLAEETRAHEYVRLGVSPRGTLALAALSRAEAWMSGRDFVTPEDVQAVFADCCRHRLILLPKAALASVDADAILSEVLDKVEAPKTDA